MLRHVLTILASILAPASIVLAAGLLTFYPTPPTSQFYVAANGHNLNPGLQSMPWKDCTPVNTRAWQPGDGVHFRGGDTFACGLVLGTSDAGTSGSPVEITSYGTGRAILQNATGEVIAGTNTTGFNIHDINISGSSKSTNGNLCVHFTNTTTTQLGFIRLTDMDISQCGKRGWQFESVGTSAKGFDDVRVLRVDSHDNGWDGAWFIAWTTAGTTTYRRDIHTNVYVGYSEVYNNLGTVTHPEDLFTGFGVLFIGVDGGLVEHNHVHHNGAPTTSGGVGLLSGASNALTFQFNEVDHHDAGTFDGDGIDCDFGSTACVVQYNYSHDNAGAGYQWWSGFNSMAWGGGTILRYNLSIEDGRKRYASIFIHGDSANTIHDADAYGNTVVASANGNGGSCLSPDSATANCGLAITADRVSGNVALKNNLLVTSGSAPLYASDTGQTGLTIAGGGYWPGSDSFAMYWDGVLKTTLAAWRTASGQETGTGTNADPTFAAGSGTNAYKLDTGSPMINAGVTITSPGAQDFFDNAVPNGAFDVGAHEKP